MFLKSVEKILFYKILPTIYLALLYQIGFMPFGDKKLLRYYGIFTNTYSALGPISIVLFINHSYMASIARVSTWFFMVVGTQISKLKLILVKFLLICHFSSRKFWFNQLCRSVSEQKKNV